MLCCVFLEYAILAEKGAGERFYWLLLESNDRVFRSEEARCEQLSKVSVPPTFAGRGIGTVVFVSTQSLIGAIHIFFGLWLLSASTAGFLYSVYTTVFGLLSLIFALGFWMGKNWGWLGTVCILLFVTVADALTLLNLPSIPGIPRFAAFAEIVYSVLILLYLAQPHVRAKMLFGKTS